MTLRDKLYGIKAVKENGKVISVGGLTIEKVGEYETIAKQNGWAYEIIDEAKEAKIAWAKA
jgi:hypothetical protein